MPEGIFLIRPDKRLTELTEQPYDSKALLQGLLAAYPDLRAGKQIDPGAPRRWLLVTRGAAVYDEFGGPGRWSVDHLGPTQLESGGILSKATLPWAEPLPRMPAPSSLSFTRSSGRVNVRRRRAYRAVAEAAGADCLDTLRGTRHGMRHRDNHD